MTNSKTFVGTVTMTFEFFQSDLALDCASPTDKELLEKWKNKRLDQLSEEELSDVFDLAFRSAIEEPSMIEFEIDVDEDER